MGQFQPVGPLADVVKMDDYLRCDIMGLSVRRYLLAVQVIDLAVIALKRLKL